MAQIHGQSSNNVPGDSPLKVDASGNLKVSNLDSTGGASTIVAPADQVADPQPKGQNVNAVLYVYNGSSARLEQVHSADYAHNNDLGGMVATAGLLWNGSTWQKPGTINVADGLSLGGISAAAVSSMYFNEATLDKPRGNAAYTILSSAARTAAATSATQTNFNGRGIILFLVITGNAGVAKTLSMQLNGLTPSSVVFPLATATLVTNSSGVQIIVLYPGATTALPNDIGVSVTTASILPRFFQVVVTPSDATSWTYSVEGYIIL